VKLVNIHNKMPDLTSKVRTLPHGLCNHKTGSHCRVLDVRDKSVTLM